MRSVTCAFVTLTLLISARTMLAEVEPGVIFDMDTIVHQPNAITIGNAKTYAGTVKLVEGKFGKAVRFSFVDNAKGGFMVAHFPINSTDWQKINVRWSDLTPELAAPLVDAAHGYAPSLFGNFWFGKWFYWRDCYETMRELETAARDVAKETHVALVDIATEFRKAGTADQALASGYWAWDKTHLGKPGHELTAKQVLGAISEE